MFHDIGAAPAGQHDAAAAQLFNGGAFQAPQAWDAKWCQAEVPPLPGARKLSTRLARSRQLFDAWCQSCGSMNCGKHRPQADGGGRALRLQERDGGAITSAYVTLGTIAPALGDRGLG